MQRNNNKKNNSGNISDNDSDFDNREKVQSLVEMAECWYRASGDAIQRARDYLYFLYVDQWEPEHRSAREERGRATLEFNQLVPIIRSILGEQRENSPAIYVRPINGKKIDSDSIELREGMMRQTHYRSNADVVFQTASKQMLECGWGAVRVRTEDEAKDSFKQCVVWDAIQDFQTAFWDPTAQKSDKSDGDFCGVYCVMSMEKFKKLNPKIENPQSATPPSGGYYFLNWTSRESIIICEIYVKEYFNKKIVELSDGNVVNKKDAEEILEKQQEFLENSHEMDRMDYAHLEIVNEKEIQDYKIKHYKFIHNLILEEVEWPGKILPVIYFEGDYALIDAERIPLPYVQDAVDSQKVLNLARSEMADALMRSRKETIIGTPTNFEGHEDEWRNADRIQGALTYEYDEKAGKPDFISPPIFNPVLFEQARESEESIKRCLGFYNEAAGQQSNAQSGYAIDLRQQASSKPANVYQDNWARGIAQVGKVTLDLWPHIYDTQRDVTIISKEGESKVVTINKVAGKVFKQNGDYEEEIENSLEDSDYDVEVKVQGSYDSQRLEQMKILLGLASANPAINNLIADFIAENSGFEKTEKLVERLKTLLPPEILAKEEGKPMPQAPPPQPPPELIIADMKNKVAMQELQLKKAQLALEEQKLMMEQQQSGLDHQATLTKAMAEIKKANTSKDIALINHHAAIRKNHSENLKSMANMSNISQ